MKKTILITGAGTGIGKDAAFALALRGHRVLATTQTEAQVNALKAEASNRNVVLEIFKLDITLEADRESISAYPIDVLINNAGYGLGGFFEDLTDDELITELMHSSLTFYNEK